jgi:hypothetical protein
MQDVDRDTLDSVLLELDRLCRRLKIWIENGDFKMVTQICEAIISTIEEAELD